MKVNAACHVHSSWSYDGSWPLDALHDEFASRGNSVVLMTEHDRGFTNERFNEYKRACQRASSCQTLLVPGIEYSDPANVVHVLTWGVPFLGEGPEIRHLLEAVEEVDGVAVLAHPSRKDALRFFPLECARLIHGVEVWNRKYDGWAPRSPAALPSELSLAVPFVGLDFHTGRQLFPLTMEMDVRGGLSEETVLESLRSRRFRARALGRPLDSLFVRALMPPMRVGERARRIGARLVRRATPSRSRPTSGSVRLSLPRSPTRTIPHVVVCVCTFKRPQLLAKLLDCVERQRVEEQLTYSVVVVDNDCERSAEQTVSAFQARGRLAVSYHVEPRRNIALARNKALEKATGDFIAFIDDDEWPEEDWLLALLRTCEAHQAHGVLGPVKPSFEVQPPSWVTKGKFFDRPTHSTGSQLTWVQTRSGNVLLRRAIVDGIQSPFRPEFDTAGEDVDFFRRMMERGHRFVWCQEAAVHELVPACRCSRAYLFRRALLRGSNFPKHPDQRLQNALKSAMAIPCYLLSLPVMAIAGQHVFLKYAIKVLDHASRLLAFLGIRVVTERR